MPGVTFWGSHVCAATATCVRCGIAAFRATPHFTGEVFVQLLWSLLGPRLPGWRRRVRPSGLFQLMLLIGFLVVGFTSPSWACIRTTEQDEA